MPLRKDEVVGKGDMKSGFFESLREKEPRRP